MRAAHALILAAASSAGAAAAQVDSVPIWEGRVEIRRTGAYERSRTGARPNLADKTTARYRLVADTLTLEACGAEGRLFVTRAVRSFEERYELDDDQQVIRQTCPLPEEAMRHNALYRAKHYKPEVKSPGDTQSTREVSAKTHYAESDTPRLEPTTGVSLTVSDSGAYELEVSGGGYGSFLSDTVTRVHHQCSGETSTTELHVRTADMKAQPSTRREVAGEGDSRREILNEIRRPSPLATLGFTARGRCRDDRISGVRPDTEDRPVVIPRTAAVGDVPSADTPETPPYQVLQTNEWAFGKKDLCQEGREALATARKFVDCYHDPSLVRSAPNAAAYEGAVDECVRSRARSEGHRGSRVGVDAYVDFTDCRLVLGEKRGASLDELREQLRDGYRCSPDELLEATVEHERKHIEQCREAAAGRGLSSPVVAKSLNEEEAYCHEAKLISDYLHANCRETGGDLEGIKTICGSKFR